MGIEAQWCEKDVRCLIDQHQLEQVLINLLKNSMESIGQKGTIPIYVSDNPPRILIADNGQGITPEQSENLFSPFYSTKVNGQGIGLTLTREVLHQHRASFSLETKASGWTECELVFLPGE